MAGSFAGNLAGTKVQQHTLRRVFAFFLLVMGGFILWQEIPKVL